jgi:hypothetical protein
MVQYGEVECPLVFVLHSLCFNGWRIGADRIIFRGHFGIKWDMFCNVQLCTYSLPTRFPPPSFVALLLICCTVWLAQADECGYVRVFEKTGFSDHFSDFIPPRSSEGDSSTIITIACNTTLHALQQHIIPTFPAYFLTKLDWSKGRVKKCQKWPLPPLRLRKSPIWISASRSNSRHLMVRCNTAAAV